MFLKVLNLTFTITGFVLSMMLLTDLLSALTKGRIFKNLKKGISGYFFAALLGVIPGCFGTFFAVSLFIHGEITIGALTTAMIATSGDEAFVMLSLFPLKMLILSLLLIVVGILVGLFVDFFSKKIKYDYCVECIHEYHSGEISMNFSFKILKENILNISFARLLLLLLLFTFLYHSFSKEAEIDIWVLRGILIFSIIIIFFVSEHYLTEHIFNHILKKHFLRLLIFTFIGLLFSEIISKNIDIKEYISSNIPLMILLSSLVGIIPESGPHLIFVFLFANKVIPFSVLVASSISQDGHGMLPLFSASLKVSIFIKIINVITGIIVGLLLFYSGF